MAARPAVWGAVALSPLCRAAGRPPCWGAQLPPAASMDPPRCRPSTRQVSAPVWGLCVTVTPFQLDTWAPGKFGLGAQGPQAQAQRCPRAPFQTAPL